MIIPDILEDAKEFAHQADTAYPGLEHFIEREVEKEYRTAAAARGFRRTMKSARLQQVRSGNIRRGQPRRKVER